jgi:hypothetical protein
MRNFLTYLPLSNTLVIIFGLGELARIFLYAENSDMWLWVFMTVAWAWSSGLSIRENRNLRLLLATAIRKLTNETKHRPHN